MRQFKEMAAFNAWSNARFRSVLKTIPLEKFNIETPYGLLIERIIHIFVSVNMWLDRIKDNSPLEVSTAKNYGSWQEIEDAWVTADKRLLDFVSQFDNPDHFEKEVSYKSLKTNNFSSTINNILIHLSHHQMYHREQIAMILRQFEPPPVPSTDEIVFFVLRIEIGI